MLARYVGQQLIKSAKCEETLKCIIGSVIADHMVQILFLKLKKKKRRQCIITRPIVGLL